MTEIAGKYKGMEVKEARKKIIEDLKKGGFLVKQKNIDIVVLGNVGIKSLKGLVIGNTAEKIIKNLSSDIIVINALQ